MFTRLILFLCKKIKWLDRNLSDFSNSYISQTPKGAAALLKKKTNEQCRRDLEAINSYYRNADLTIEPPVRLIEQPKQGAL